MAHNFLVADQVSANDKVILITPVVTKNFSQWVEMQAPFVKNWMQASNFIAKQGSLCLVPDQSGRLSQVFIGMNSGDDFWEIGSLPTSLPPGIYQFDLAVSFLLEGEFLQRMVLAWGLGHYQFDRYKQLPTKRLAWLVLPESSEDYHFDALEANRSITAITWARDLINTPTQDMGPLQLAQAALSLVDEFGGKLTQIVGDDLLSANYPGIHAVGRASAAAPRLIDLRWGDSAHPKLCLVGKGVCYDTGGLNIKVKDGMRYMKKDMAGAAHALGLARMVMSANLPINLRVLIPAVENSISGNAYRAGDIIRSRNGLTIEINNTDAEGRVILADALAEAMSDNPALVLDFATLTGAGRVALGPDLPALFCDHNPLLQNLLACGQKEQDPLWPLPLFTPYRKFIDSPIADISNTSSSPYGGAITAALFLKEFVNPDIPWAHFDLMAWNLRSLPARPEGGEAMALRACFRYLQENFI